ncbi:hypothetical protein IEQ34_013830 [Dendrobium chrysotoxum]|uniref:Uncharacterized protein n=1 Tax=Dendrobium chrysotoxum TaxID=161865 RepID=A0AAV7GQH7_DENCH|nr:hypothetical protein IEQ34_013830 [Dendrobium chrysotoxum]
MLSRKGLEGNHPRVVLVERRVGLKGCYSNKDMRCVHMIRLTLAWNDQLATISSASDPQSYHRVLESCFPQCNVSASLDTVSLTDGPIAVGLTDHRSASSPEPNRANPLGNSPIHIWVCLPSGYLDISSLVLVISIPKSPISNVVPLINLDGVPLEDLHSNWDLNVLSRRLSPSGQLISNWEKAEINSANYDLYPNNCQKEDVLNLVHIS